ncbi:MAG: NAD synthetase [Rhodopirellula sp.]|nr:NAD synthetase [Rhodopirellula sp.]MCH2597968.1 NAD(P)(+) transhydrogenase (Re/Si-specific) subunit beta [Pirellulales bacterium]
MELNTVIFDVLYLLAAILFIMGIKKMGHPRTAVTGNLLGVVGMLLAAGVSFLITLENESIQNSLTLPIGTIVGAIFIGTLFGTVLATRVQMTEMPQLVAVFNGVGGLASVLVAAASLMATKDSSIPVEVVVAGGVSGLIGAVTFVGSGVAAGKLQELNFFKKQLPIPTLIRHVLNLAMLIGCGWCVFEMIDTGNVLLYLVICVLGCALGYTLTTPIGGADMPVVIALLNSYSGLAAAATGFVVDQPVLIISGSLVGASGIILTSLMCKAMNRSLLSVLFGGGMTSSYEQDEGIYATVKRTTAEDVAMMVDFAERVVFVPGYGMAVAQAQNAVSDLAAMIEQRGATVEYAIHPVAGRMPGHMNVLLAEADVSYEQLRTLEEINPDFDEVDIAIVLGANDVVNPEARKEGTPVSGMPILNVDEARQVVVIKRSLSPGYAKIANPLFAADNTSMLFGDGKAAIQDISAALKEL